MQGFMVFLKPENKEVHIDCKSLCYHLCSPMLLEEEPLKLLIQEKGIGNVVYNNMNGNASVLCPYFICMCAVSEP